jgi:hypothetical protein
MTIPGSQLREAIGRQTVRFRVSRLRRIIARPFGLTIADTAVMLGDESSSTGLVAEIRAAVTRAPVRLDSISLLYGAARICLLPSSRSSPAGTAGQPTIFRRTRANSDVPCTAMRRRTPSRLSIS